MIDIEISRGKMKLWNHSAGAQNNTLEMPKSTTAAIIMTHHLGYSGCMALSSCRAWYYNDIIMGAMASQFTSRTMVS